MVAKCGKVYGIIVMLVTEAEASDWKEKGKSHTTSLDIRTLKMSSLTRRLTKSGQ